MNTLVWSAQAVLALVFLTAGVTKLTQPKAKLAATLAWVEDFSDTQVRGIGLVELVAGEQSRSAESADPKRSPTPPPGCSHLSPAWSPAPSSVWTAVTSTAERAAPRHPGSTQPASSVTLAVT
jgi:uncharacterized protein YjeT (DUF2065 family)